MFGQDQILERYSDDNFCGAAQNLIRLTQTLFRLYSTFRAHFPLPAWPNGGYSLHLLCRDQGCNGCSNARSIFCEAHPN